MSPFLVLLAAVALVLCAIREDTPVAITPRRAWKQIRAAGWRRVAWTTLRVTAGVLVIPLYTAIRCALYGVTLALAAGACRIATLASFDRRPVRVRRLEIYA